MVGRRVRRRGGSGLRFWLGLGRRRDGLGFRFRYELVRQVLLESISPARRQLLHERLDDNTVIVLAGGSQTV